MQVTVVGLKKVDFETDKGRQLGLKIYCTFKPDDMRNFEGVCADSLYINLDFSPFGVPDELKIGDEIQLIYNRSGLSASAKDKLVAILDKSGKQVHCIKKESLVSAF